MGCQSRSSLQASKGLKLGLHGHYSIERLCALHEYSETKSYLHAAIVCVPMSMPPLVSVVILEMMPLHDPSAGWNNNTVFWIRSFVGIFIISVGVALQLQAMAPAASLDLRQCLLLSLVAASSYVASLLPIAEYAAFPVPFTLVAGVPAWALCLFPGMALAIGVTKLKHDTTLRMQFLRFGNKIILESNFVVIYPVYSLVFLSLSGASQFFFMFVLQIIKLVLKKSMVKLVPDMEDLVPVVVISIDSFNALYQSKCMQSAGSFLATAGIIAVDAVQNVLVLRGLFRHMEDVMAAGQLSVDSKEGLLAHVLAVVDDPDTMAVEALLDVCVAASPSLRLPDEQKKLIDRLRTAQQIHLDSETSSPVTVSFKPATIATAPPRATSTASALVSPAPVTECVKLGPTTLALPVQAADAPGAEEARFVKKTLQLLFKCELVLLVEYIESAISLLYAVYLLILYHLPNARYYAKLVEVTPSELQAAVLGIVVYALLEALSLVAVHCALRWKFRVSALHQLAFVFQTDWLVIQSAFMAWVLMILQFTLEHNGASPPNTHSLSLFSHALSLLVGADADADAGRICNRGGLFVPFRVGAEWTVNLNEEIVLVFCTEVRRVTCRYKYPDIGLLLAENLLLRRSDWVSGFASAGPRIRRHLHFTWRKMAFASSLSARDGDDGSATQRGGATRQHRRVRRPRGRAAADPIHETAADHADPARGDRRDAHRPLPRALDAERDDDELGDDCVHVDHHDRDGRASSAASTAAADAVADESAEGDDDGPSLVVGLSRAQVEATDRYRWASFFVFLMYVVTFFVWPSYFMSAFGLATGIVGCVSCRLTQERVPHHMISVIVFVACNYAMMVFLIWIFVSSFAVDLQKKKSSGQPALVLLVVFIVIAIFLHFRAQRVARDFMDAFKPGVTSTQPTRPRRPIAITILRPPRPPFADGNAPTYFPTTNAVQAAP